MMGRPGSYLFFKIYKYITWTNGPICATIAKVSDISQQGYEDKDVDQLLMSMDIKAVHSHTVESLY